MSNSKIIKSRIRSIKSTKKITKAMELVAASKMKRAVSRALSSRLYAGYSWELLTSLSSRLEEVTHPFFIEPKEGKTLIVLITSNRGLCGSYNSQVIKKTLTKLEEFSFPRTVLGKNNCDMITVGKKGDSAMRRVGINITASFTDMPDNATLSDITPLSKLLINEYKTGKYKHIFVAYTDFVSALTQKANIRKILPISKQEIKELVEEVTHEKAKEKEDKNEVPYVIEGDTNTLIESLAEKLTRMQIYQMILESSASEQSSRMVAMKNASEAAGEMIDDLTLVFNKARQAGITQEISEISAGMASIS